MGCPYISRIMCWMVCFRRSPSESGFRNDSERSSPCEFILISGGKRVGFRVRRKKLRGAPRL
jgi:hypothetical protein